MCDSLERDKNLEDIGVQFSIHATLLLGVSADGALAARLAIALGFAADTLAAGAVHRTAWGFPVFAVVHHASARRRPQCTSLSLGGKSGGAHGAARFGSDVAGGKTMIPSTPEELRDCLRGWPVRDLRAAIAEALPGVDRVTVNGVADWLLSEVSDFHPPLGAKQIAAIWQALQRRAQ